MPSVSEKQRGFFGIAKAIKSGKNPVGINPGILNKARKVAKTQSSKTIGDFLTINPAKALKNG